MDALRAIRGRGTRDSERIVGNPENGRAEVRASMHSPGRAFSAQSRQIREMTIRQSARANWPSLL
jgi:hypothetical protein